MILKPEDLRKKVYTVADPEFDFTPTDPGIRPGSWAVTAMVCEPLEMLVENIRHYRALGAEYILFFFDKPDDPAFETIAAMDGVIAVRCDEDYWQKTGEGKPGTVPRRIGATYRNGVRLMRFAGVQWCLGADVDELLFSTIPVADLLREQDADKQLLWLQTAEAIHHQAMRSGSVFSSEYFKRFVAKPTRIQRFALRMVYGERRQLSVCGFYGQRAGKTFCRTTAPIEVYNCHRPFSRSEKLAAAGTAKAFILHFDAISPEHWRHKWVPRASGQENHRGISAVRQKQQQHIKAALEDSDEALRKLFRQWHYFSAWKILLLNRCGLMIRIDPGRRIPRV